MNKNKELYRLNDPFFNDAFDRTVVNIHLRKQDNGDKVFVVCGCEPFAGTTTIAINLAITLALSGWKTMLLDVDMRKESVYKTHYESTNNLAVHLADEADLNNIICTTNYENLSYISAGTPAVNPIQLLCSSKMSSLIENLRKEYDYIIIDSPSPGASADASILASLSDEVVLVARWEHTTTRSIRETHNAIKNSGADVLGIVMNRMDITSYRHYYRDCSYLAGSAYKKNSRSIKSILRKK